MNMWSASLGGSYVMNDGWSGVMESREKLRGPWGDRQNGNLILLNVSSYSGVHPATTN